MRFYVFLCLQTPNMSKNELTWTANFVNLQTVLIAMLTILRWVITTIAFWQLMTYFHWIDLLRVIKLIITGSEQHYFSWFSFSFSLSFCIHEKKEGVGSRKKVFVKDSMSKRKKMLFLFISFHWLSSIIMKYK